MPKQTFLNLPEPKRRRVVNALFQEFSTHSYDLASLNSIVMELGIAKGSLYQYFENKADIYRYLIDLVVQDKFRFLEERITKKDADLFERLRSMIASSAAFARAHPLYVAFFDRLLSEKDCQALGDMPERLQRSSEAYIRGLLEADQSRGLLEPGLNIDLAAFLIGALITEFGKYLRRRSLGVHPDSIDEAELDSLMAMIKRGIGRP